MIASLFPNTASANFIRVIDYVKEFFTWQVLFPFLPLIHCFKGCIFYTLPQKVILLFLELFEEKIKQWFFFFSDQKKIIFSQLLVRRLSVPAAPMISTGCFCVPVCGKLVHHPACFSSSHCRAWQNPGKLHLWEKQLGVKAVLLIRFSLVRGWCW